MVEAPELKNSVVQLTVVNAPADRCNRCGECCKMFTLKYSPARLRDMAASDSHDEYRKIFDAVGDRCLGRLVWPETGYVAYAYGPCRNLGVTADGLPACLIHDSRPNMCSGFPYYSMARGSPAILNPSPYIGCGYNADMAFGEQWMHSEGIKPYLSPLNEDEL